MDNKELAVQEETGLATVDPQALISQAIDKGLPIETLERLLAMRMEVKREMARDVYFKNLAEFQKECPVIIKKKKVYDKNNKYRYSYAPIEDIIEQTKELMQKYGFSFIIKTEQDKESVTAICEVHHKYGHSEQAQFRIPIDASLYMNIAQKVASALTFAKRYALQDAFGIVTGTEDDDSNITGEPVQKTKPETEQGKPTKVVTFSNAPEENKSMYQAIMALFREKINGKDIFTPKEKADYKKSADFAIGDLNALTDLCKIINKLANDRRGNK